MTDTPHVEVRLKEVFYSNSIEYEEGSGSLTNVVSDASKPRYTSLGGMPLDEAREMTAADVEHHGIYLEADSGDGFEEYSYVLEYLDPEKQEWRHIKTVR